jgi:Flp pilus assembly protein TadD
MAFCGNCGAEIEQGAKFCGGCGQPLGDVVQGRLEEKIQELTPMVEPPVKKRGRWKKAVILAVILLFVVGVIFVIGSNLDYWVQHDKFGLGKLSSLYPGLKSKETKISPPKPAPVKPTPPPFPSLTSPPVRVPSTPIEPPRVIPEVRTGISYIGVEIQNLTKEVADSVGLLEGSGVLVRSVKPSGPAELAGILPGDIILKFKDTWVTDIRIFTEMVRTTPPGTRSPVYIDRRGKRFYINVIVGRLDKEKLSFSEEHKKLTDSNFRKGQRLNDQKDYARAIAYFNKAIALDPRLPDPYVELAHSYYELGRIDLAIANLQKAISIDPQYSPYHRLGMIYWERKQYDEAIGPLREAVRLKPPATKDTAAHGLLGHSYFAMGRTEEALDTFWKAYQIDPKVPVTVYFLGACYDRLNYRKEAAHYYRQYLNMRNNDSEMNRLAKQRLSALSRDP